MAEDYRGPKRSFLGKLPAWLKACLVKAWFAGAVFYFLGWGMFISDTLDLLAVLGLVHGLVMDLLANRLLLFFETDKLNYQRYIFHSTRRFISVPVNLAYGVVLSVAVAYLYHFINLFVFLGAEPILYGLLFMGCDMFFIFIKHIAKGLFHS